MRTLFRSLLYNRVIKSREQEYGDKFSLAVQVRGSSGQYVAISLNHTRAQLRDTIFMFQRDA